MFCSPRLLVTVLLAITLTASAVIAEDATSENKVDMLIGFEVFRQDFAEQIGIDEEASGYFQLSDIEAFFLLCRKDQPANENWPPKRKTIEFGKALTGKYVSDAKGADYSLTITPARVKDDENIRVTIEAPEGSAFALKQKLELSMPNGSVVYVASQKLLAGEKQLYLVLRMDTGEAEE